MERQDYRDSTGPGQGNLFRYGLFGALVLVWGSTWLVIRISLELYPPFLTLAARFLGAGLAFLAYIRWRRIPIPWTGRTVLFYTAVGLLSFVISYGVVYWGEQYVTSGLAAVIFGLFPIFTALCTRALLRHEQVTLAGWIGLILGLLGIVCLNLEDLEQMHPMAPLASVVLVISPLASAVSAVITKRTILRIHPFVIAGVPMTLAGLVHAGIWAVQESHLPLAWSWPGVWATVYLTVAGTVFTFGGYYWLLQHMRVSTLATIAYFTPVVALAVGAALGGEPLTWPILLGAALILSGTALVGRRQGRP